VQGSESLQFLGTLEQWISVPDWRMRVGSMRVPKLDVR